MLDETELDGVLLVVGFDDESGEPLYPDVACEVLSRGIPVWMEKPPAANADGVRRMCEAAAAGGTFGQVGFKKVFSPGVARLRDLTSLADFGELTGYTYTYNVDLPPVVGDLRSPSGRRFLDDFVHVASVLESVVGVPAMTQAFRSPSGTGVVVNQHASGMLGTVLLTDSASGLAPVERFEVVGTGANAVLDNGVDLAYFPPGNRGPYGRSTSYIPAITQGAAADFGPRFWRPEFSLGNLHGGTHFLQGYYHQMEQFVACVRDGGEPRHAGLESAHRVMSYMDALIGAFGEWRLVGDAEFVTFEHEVDRPDAPQCPATGKDFALKDGWNYVCRDCGRTWAGTDRGAPVCRFS